MKQIGTVFAFEFKSYIKNKVFVGTTIFFILIIAFLMFFPRIVDVGTTKENIESVAANLAMLGEIESKSVNSKIPTAQNFFYTYIMVFALYITILLYGRMVATNIATEKNSRTMEVLITSVPPTLMIFGKILASCLAGLVQLVSVFGSAILCFNINKLYWGENIIVNSMLDIPISLFGFMLIFFLLGFFVYAFLYGAIGSITSNLEDINVLAMPITMLFVVAFFIVIFSLASGSVDSFLIKVCSFVPFISPMAMFARIAISIVPWYEVVISIFILVASIIGTGILSAKIYCIGVLFYGTRPKIITIIRSAMGI